MEDLDVKFGCLKSYTEGEVGHGDLVISTKWDIFSTNLIRPQTGVEKFRLVCPKCHNPFYVEAHSHDSMNNIKKSRYIYAAVFALIALTSYLLGPLDLGGVKIDYLFIAFGVGAFIYTLSLNSHLSTIMNNCQGLVHLTKDKRHRLLSTDGQVRQKMSMERNFLEAQPRILCGHGRDPRRK